MRKNRHEKTFCNIGDGMFKDEIDKAIMNSILKHTDQINEAGGDPEKTFNLILGNIMKEPEVQACLVKLNCDLFNKKLDLITLEEYKRQHKERQEEAKSGTRKVSTYIKCKNCDVPYRYVDFDIHEGNSVTNHEIVCDLCSDRQIIPA
jgi:hypothetical protein